MANTRLVAPIFLVVLVTLGCSQLRDLATKNGSTNSNTAGSNSSAANSTSSGSTDGVASSADPRADIEKMADRFMEQKAFQARMTGTGDTPSSTEVKFVAPDRFHVVTGNGMETIIIAKVMYMKLGGRWQKMSENLDSIPDMRKAFDEEGRKWFSDVKFVGEDIAGGKPALVYQYHNKGPGGVGENDSKVWIARTDGLPVKIEATYKSGNLKSMLIEYKYDQAITIEPPIK